MGDLPITALGQQFLDSLPPVLRSSSDYRSAMHALARELELLAAQVEVVRAQLNPATATVLLSAWESQLRLPIGLGTTAQRQQAVLARLRWLLGSSEGRAWEQRITDLVGQGWTYQEHIPGNSFTPPANTLKLTIPFSGADFNRVLAEIRQVTAAHLDLQYAVTGGFQLDHSQLDNQAMIF